MNILKAIATVALGLTVAQAGAQSVVIKLNGEEPIKYPADRVEYIQFNDEEAFDENNLLQEAYIPDPVLREWIVKYVTKGVEYLTREEAAAYTGSLNFDGFRGLKNMEGIQYFTSVTSFDINCLTTIDVKSIPVMENITYANLMSCKFGNFDPIALFPNARNLIISLNDLTGTLTIKSDNLVRLDCGLNDNLSGLDVSGCPKLSQLLSTRCNLTDIKLGAAKLTGLYMYANKLLSEIDLSNCKETLRELTVSDTSISNLDLKGCSELTYLDMARMPLEEFPDISDCHQLETLRCEENGIKTLDLTGLDSLQELFCFSNGFDVLDLTPCKYISQVMAWDNGIKEVKTRGCEYLGNLCVSNNALSRLDISDNEHMWKLECAVNPDLTEIKVWEGFDIQNPPENFYIPESAKYVYEFSE